MKRTFRMLALGLLVVLTLALGSCGSDDGLLNDYTVDCPKGPLAFWSCNMTWDQQCWQ